MTNCISITNTCHDIQTRNKLVEDNLRFVFWCADEFSTYNVPHDELISAGNEALINSANRFDPTCGTHFISYAVPSTSMLPTSLRQHNNLICMSKCIKRNEKHIFANRETLIDCLI